MADLELFVETLRNENGKYHQIDKGNVYLINFTPSDSTLLAGHKDIIDRLIGPFLVRATKHLGPGPTT